MVEPAPFVSSVLSGPGTRTSPPLCFPGQPGPVSIPPSPPPFPPRIPSGRPFPGPPSLVYARGGPVSPLFCATDSLCSFFFPLSPCAVRRTWLREFSPSFFVTLQGCVPLSPSRCAHGFGPSPLFPLHLVGPPKAANTLSFPFGVVFFPWLRFPVLYVPLPPFFFLLRFRCC